MEKKVRKEIKMEEAKEGLRIRGEEEGKKEKYEGGDGQKRRSSEEGMKEKDEMNACRVIHGEKRERRRRRRMREHGGGIRKEDGG